MNHTDPHNTQSDPSAQEASDSTESSRAAELSRIWLLTQLAREKWTIAKITGAFLLGGILLCIVLPVRYQAETEIMPPQQVQSLSDLLSAQMGGVGALTSMASGGLGLKDPNAIYIGMLESRPIADAIIKRFDLMHVYHVDTMTTARKKLKSRTSIQTEKSTAISIDVKDSDKQRAADMANAYVTQLRALGDTVGLSESSRRRIFYENQLKAQKDSLAASELALQKLQQNKGMLQLTAQASMMISNVAMARAELAEKKVELQVLKSFSTEHNPDVKLAEQEISALQAETEKMAQYGSSSDYADLGLKDLPTAGLDYVRAMRNVELNQDIYALLLKQYEAAKLDEANDAYIIQVMQAAIPPEKRSFPIWLVIPPIFVFLGLIVSYITIRTKIWLASAQADQERFRALQDLRSAFLRMRS